MAPNRCSLAASTAVLPHPCTPLRAAFNPLRTILNVAGRDVQQRLCDRLVDPRLDMEVSDR